MRRGFVNTFGPLSYFYCEGQISLLCKRDACIIDKQQRVWIEPIKEQWLHQSLFCGFENMEGGSNIPRSRLPYLLYIDEE